MEDINARKTPVVQALEHQNTEKGSITDIEKQPQYKNQAKVRSRHTIHESGIMLLWIGVIISVLIYCSKAASTRPVNNSNDNDTTRRATNNPNDYTQHVNIWLGTQGGGNDNPAVSRPFSMIKLGPDLFVSGTDAYSGYLPNGAFSGFSLMHEQGTGGAPKYGTVAQLPLVGDVLQPLSNLTVGRKGADEGSVGYYRATTSQDVVVELAAASRAGMYQYTFPSDGDDEKNNVLVDVSHILPSYRGMGLSQGYAEGEIRVAEDGHYEGYGVYNNGWNRSPDWTIYFCGYFDTAPVSNKTYTATDSTGSIEQPSGHAQSNSSAVRIGSLFTFNSTQVTSRVGISWLSTSQACTNLQNEIPSGTEFTKVVNDTKSIWNEQVLSKITTSATNSTTLELLYTSLYYMHLIPTNQTGENPGWTSDEPYYQDIFTFWDLFRCGTSLMQILQPIAYEEQIRSLIDIYRHEGYMPDARSSNYNGRTQGGSNADNVLADAYVKGVRGKINWIDGYAAMVKNAEMPPPNTIPPDPQAPDSSTKEGRGALPDWKAYGFITPKYTRAVSRAVEYAYNDFGLYQVALGLQLTADAEKYLDRSRNWRNHWNPNATSLGYSGFVVPRDLTQGFQDIDILASGYWGDACYEASPWAYSFTDVHDAAHMIKLMGGEKSFEARLNTTFQQGADGTYIFDPTNEPMFTIPYLYNYINRPDLSVLHSRHIAKTYYNTGVKGLPGNSDAGAMQTWLLWNMIGLYPITGQTTFLIHSPWFESMSIDLGEGKRLNVTSTGGDNNGDTDYIVKSVRVNGREWERGWLSWDDVFVDGGLVEFELGKEPVQWARGDVPPSPASS
ncbi:alpha-1,2-mannosidase family protein [Talaromyces stipitatus ATCC 10500]|uniref:Alpha-1,2-mannosidase family protein n=1 Tax=Talaromyces stipitatus (strain ATCC 10500 / CBS 375.48 / QM 6759 / NRRL 1006) TaxID=441959 RepID=B8LZ92_TALSN|nr:alpha-1,2-mannosidase family protein [Talaromyces stipitatus ATCC 10500]EED21645.1 alpha-1,2-mannosidase family protein [Talaromyces stipitatus ATCC 10500]